MALQVWLPLNKNGADKNQGLGDSTITNFGAVYESSGKLGGCYKCTNSAGIHIESKPWMKMVPGNSFSVSMWIKGCSEKTWAIACTSWELIFRTNLLAIYPGGTMSNGGCSIYQTFDSNTWYYIAFSYNGDTSKLSLYLNGEFKQEYITTYRSDSISSTITLPYGDTRYINDFRIYDHCLSPKEVKEIAKGLVLHYPLNDAYVEGTSNLFSANLTYGTNWDNSGSATWNWDDNTIPKINNSIIYSISRTDTGNSAICCGRCNLVAGKTYTASVYVYLSGNTDSNIFYVRSVNTNVSALKYNNDANPQKWPQNQWIRATATFTPSVAYNNCYICTYLDSANSKRALTCWQIEEKDHVTPYTPNTRNEATVYDCSGYQNNGTITGALSCNADSPRYNKSCKFGSGIIGTISGFASAQSYTFWANVIDKTIQILFVDGVSKLGFGIWNPHFICSTTGKTSARYSIDNLTTGWHHFAVVNDLLYIDGVLQTKSSGTDTWTYSSSILEIGNRSSGTSYPWKGQISDFRIYATALSEEDIKELYNTSAYVSDNGTLLTYSAEE